MVSARTATALPPPKDATKSTALMTGNSAQRQDLEPLSRGCQHSASCLMSPLQLHLPLDDHPTYGAMDPSAEEVP